MPSNHSWKFFRAGGFDQVRIERGADLLALDQLDQKLWVALACPTTDLEFDSATLAMIDTDKDGRIRPPELIAAIKWAAGLLKNPDDLVKGASELPLSAVNDSTELGRQLLASARQILSIIGKNNRSFITLEDAADNTSILAQTNFNGDGIIPADAASDEATKKVITDIIACLGPENDRSGKPGVNQDKVNSFFADAQAYVDWKNQAEKDSAILPFGEMTETAAAAFLAVKSKVDDYFLRCRLAAFDPQALAPLNPEEKDYLAITNKEIKQDALEISCLPLAQIGAEKPLPLKAGINPAWAEAIVNLKVQTIQPIFSDKDFLSASDWAIITEKFAPYEAWMAAKAGESVENLGVVRLREILSGNGRDTITALIDRDKDLESEFNSMVDLEKLIRYYRDLYRLVNNFVSFRDFYGRKEKSLFQAGTLYLDQRSCDLCIRVNDAGKHAAIAGFSGVYLAYCDCVRKGSGEQMQIVAAITDGDSDNLMVGRNGIFYDRQGQDWDATITKIVDNPISIRQAFWAPYKKAARLIQEQFAKRVATADQAAVSSLSQAPTRLEQGAAKGALPVAEPIKKVDPGLIAALGVGAAGLGGVIGGIMTGFLNLKGFMPLGVLAILLIISGPSMIMAWMKLRRRNLGPLLDANGWAINAKAKINVPFGASLTSMAALPPGAKRDLVDPFAEKKRPWGLYIALIIVIVLLLGWAWGKFDRILSALSPKITSSWVIQGKSPSDVVAPPATQASGEQKK